MPNGAMPEVDETSGTIKEYSMPITGKFPLPQPRKNIRPIPPKMFPHVGNVGNVVEHSVLNPNLKRILPLNQLMNLQQEEIQTENILINESFVTRRYAVNDALDGGHRHFSSMHWLYPNSLSFSDMGFGRSTAERTTDNKRTFEAVRKTMMRKKTNNGGHTSWSARCLRY